MRTIRPLLPTLIAAATVSGAAAAEDRYVTAGTLNVRLCPAEGCPVTNRLYRGQKVEVLEEEGGWARISQFYDSGAERMEFPEVTDDEVARWVASAYLSAAWDKLRAALPMGPSGTRATQQCYGTRPRPQGSHLRLVT